MSASGSASKETLSLMALVAPRHHPFFYIGGVFLNAVVFSVVGPPVGGFVLVAARAAMRLSTADVHVGLLGYFAFFFVTVPVSYFIAFLPAFVTGIVVAFASVWITSSRSLYAIAAIVGGAVSMLLLARSEFLMRDTDLVSSFVSFALSGSVAALACTRLTRPFRLAVAAGNSPPGERLAKEP